MTIRELISQFDIQGAYCIKRWREDWNDYAKFAEGKDFESDILNIHICKECLDAEIAYMYAVDGVLNIELEWD